jgi:hypothetical protein
MLATASRTERCCTAFATFGISVAVRHRHGQRDVDLVAVALDLDALGAATGEELTDPGRRGDGRTPST